MVFSIEGHWEKHQRFTVYFLHTVQVAGSYFPEKPFDGAVPSTIFGHAFLNFMAFELRNGESVWRVMDLFLLDTLYSSNSLVDFGFSAFRQYSLPWKYPKIYN